MRSFGVDVSGQIHPTFGAEYSHARGLNPGAQAEYHLDQVRAMTAWAYMPGSVEAAVRDGVDVLGSTPYVEQDENKTKMNM